MLSEAVIIKELLVEVPANVVKKVVELLVAVDDDDETLVI